MYPSSPSRVSARTGPRLPDRAAGRTGGAIRRRSPWTWVRTLLAAGSLSLSLAAPSPAAPAVSIDRSAAGGAELEPRGPLVEQAPLSGAPEDGLPTPRIAPGRGDTIDFGFYEIRPDGLPYALRDGVWTFDHGAADPLEGWTSDDRTTNDHAYWRAVSEAIWAAEGNPPPWPQMNDSPGIALCGTRRGYADSLNWAAGTGYGNLWCQRLVSPALTYDGTGDVHLGFRYFNETELGYDYCEVVLQVGGNRTVLNPPGFNGPIGIDSQGVIAPALYERTITNAELGGGIAPREFRVVLEVNSDGMVSDEDGSEGFDAFYGATGIDEFVIDGVNLIPPVSQVYTFDDGLQGWTPEICPGVGSYLGVAHISQYAILDPGCCFLRGYVMEMHDDELRHPEGQHECAISPIVDRRTDIGDPTYLEYNQIQAEWEMYADMPITAGVFYRPGWTYYPYENPHIPGFLTWSPRTGSAPYYYLGGGPSCFVTRNVGTDWGVPGSSERVRFIFELLYDCSVLGAPCTEEPNFTPLLDNLRIRNAQVPNAPGIQFAPGGRFQDGFGQSADGLLSPYDRGNANTAFNLRFSTQNPARLGDSLVIVGPTPAPDGSTKWEARLWFRLRRFGPVQTQIYDYLRWQRALAAKGIDFWSGPEPAFTWGYMDSVEVGINVARNRFCSQFRDGPSSGGGGLPADPCFNWGGGGEQGEGNEMLPDQVFTPGTQVQYFVTSNYICLPGEYFYLPDTSGGYFEEFEILPGYRLDGGVTKFPCILYVNANGPDRLRVIPHGLNAALHGAGLDDPIPRFTMWDQYDYLDAAASWIASMWRDPGGDNGATMQQLLGYRAMLASTGRLGTGATRVRDWEGFQAWLESPLCDGDLLPQGFLADGCSVSEIVAHAYPSFLSANLGGSHLCTDYSRPDCPPGDPDNDTQWCVRLRTTSGSPGVPLDLFGNWCPAHADFDVLGATGAGVGTMDYEKIGTGTRTPYAQVVHDRLGGPHRYRTVLNGFSSLYLTSRDLDHEGDPDLECPSDFASRVGAVATEWGGYLKWMLNISDPTTIGLCLPHPDCASPLIDVPEEDPGAALVNRLYPGRPNPFNPRATIRFSLAAAGKATVRIYETTGRAVRTLVDGPEEAGLHEVVWDGTDDAGRRLPSGVYWCRLQAAGFVSSRRLVILK